MIFYRPGLIFYRRPTSRTFKTSSSQSVNAEILGPVVRGPGGTKPYDLTINYNQYVATPRPVPRYF